jgi:hypothetical protein
MTVQKMQISDAAVPTSSLPLLLRLGDRIPFIGIYFTILSGFFFTMCKLGTKLMPTVHPVMIVCIRYLFELKLISFSSSD